MKMSLLISGENNSGKSTFIENLCDERNQGDFFFYLKTSNQVIPLNLIKIDKNNLVQDLQYSNYHFLGFIYIIDYKNLSNFNFEYLINIKKELKKLNKNFWSFLFFNYKGKNDKLNNVEKKILENLSNENDFFFFETNLIKKSQKYLIKKLLNLKLSFLVNKNSEIFNKIEIEKEEKNKIDKNKIRSNNRYSKINESNLSIKSKIEKEYTSRKQNIQNLLTPYINESIYLKTSKNNLRNYNTSNNKNENNYYNSIKNKYESIKNSNNNIKNKYEESIKISNKNIKNLNNNIKNPYNNINNSYNNNNSTDNININSNTNSKYNINNNSINLVNLYSNEKYHSLESKQLQGLYNKIHNITEKKDSSKKNISDSKKNICDSSFFSQKLYDEINFQTNSRLKSNQNSFNKISGLNTKNKNLMKLFDNLNSKQTNLSSNLDFSEDIDKEFKNYEKHLNFGEKIKNCDQLINLNQNMISQLDSSLNKNFKNDKKNIFNKKKKPNLDKIDKNKEKDFFNDIFKKNKKKKEKNLYEDLFSQKNLESEILKQLYSKDKEENILNNLYSKDKEENYLSNFYKENNKEDNLKNLYSKKKENKKKIDKDENLLKDLFAEKNEYLEKGFLFKKKKEENLEKNFLFNKKDENIENKIYSNISKIEKINDSENIDVSISNILQGFEIEENYSQNLTKIKSKNNLMNIRDSHDTRNHNNFRLKKNNGKNFKKNFDNNFGNKIDNKFENHFRKKKLIYLKINNVNIDIFIDDNTDTIAKKYFEKIFLKNPGNLKMKKLKNLIKIEINKEIDKLLKKNKKLETIKENKNDIKNERKRKISYNEIRNLKKSKSDMFYKNLKKKNSDQFKKNENPKMEDILNSFYEQIDKNKNEDINYIKKKEKKSYENFTKKNIKQNFKKKSEKKIEEEIKKKK